MICLFAIAPLVFFVFVGAGSSALLGCLLHDLLPVLSDGDARIGRFARQPELRSRAWLEHGRNTRFVRTKARANPLRAAA